MKKLLATTTLYLLVVLATACTSYVIGEIPPSQFEFKSVVANQEKGEAGGWRAAQVMISLGRRTGVVVCQVEVGVPGRNFAGGITVDIAQRAAASAANHAARVALGAGAGFSATLCRRFIEEMNAHLARAIPGSRVTPFTIEGLEPTTWP